MLVGSLVGGSGLYSYSTQSAPWTGRHCTHRQEEALRPSIIHFQLSTRHLHRLHSHSNPSIIHPSPLPLLLPPALTDFPHPHPTQIFCNPRTHSSLWPKRIQHSHPLIHRTLRRTRHCSIFRVPDLLRSAVVSRRILVF